MKSFKSIPIMVTLAAGLSGTAMAGDNWSQHAVQANLQAAIDQRIVTEHLGLEDRSAEVPEFDMLMADINLRLERKLDAQLLDSTVALPEKPAFNYRFAALKASDALQSSMPTMID